MASCTQGCWVLCGGLFPPLQCVLGASCRCRLLGALCVLPFLCSWSARAGRLAVLECAFGGFLLLFALLYLLPLLRHFVTCMVE